MVQEDIRKETDIYSKFHAGLLNCFLDILLKMTLNLISNQKLNRFISANYQGITDKNKLLPINV